MQERIDFIKSSNEGRSLQTVQAQLDDLSSDTQNRNSEHIYKKLNNIYEKTREMREVVNFYEKYIRDFLDRTRQEFLETLKDIERKRDGLKKQGYILYGVKFPEKSRIYHDRDGQQMPHTDIYNGVIIPSSRDEKSVNPDEMSVTTEQPLYQNKSLEDLFFHGRPYRSMYFLDDPVEDGINETYTLSYEDPVIVTKLEIKPSDCNITRILYTDNQGVNIIEVDMANPYINQFNLRNIAISVNCDSYTIKTYQVDKHRIHPDFWSMVKNDLFVNYGEQSIYNIESISGMQQHEADYNQYLYDMEVYKENKRQYEIALSQYEAAKERYERDLQAWGQRKEQHRRLHEKWQQEYDRYQESLAQYLKRKEIFEDTHAKWVADKHAYDLAFALWQQEFALWNAQYGAKWRAKYGPIAF